MNLTDLVFTGFNRRVAALCKRTGRIVWEWEAPHGRNYVTLLLDGDVLIVSVDGYMFGLHASTGAPLWCNEMAGFGIGVASLASVNGTAQNPAAAAAANTTVTAAAATAAASS